MAGKVQGDPGERAEPGGPHASEVTLQGGLRPRLGPGSQSGAGAGLSPAVMELSDARGTGVRVAAWGLMTPAGSREGASPQGRGQLLTARGGGGAATSAGSPAPRPAPPHTHGHTPPCSSPAQAVRAGVHAELLVTLAVPGSAGRDTRADALAIGRTSPSTDPAMRAASPPLWTRRQLGGYGGGRRTQGALTR